MKYPKHGIYEALYSKYLDEASLKILMDLAGEDLTGKRFLDICCGTGICTTEALKRNASMVMMIDSEPDMIPHRFRSNDRTVVRIDKANVAFNSLCNQRTNFDIAVSRQAINYWFSEKAIETLAQCLRSGGIFAFNTFNTRPTEKPKIKQYHYKDMAFTEVSYVTPDEKVHHVQIRQGYPPHIAEFMWISPERFEETLSPYFKVERIIRNRTDYYKCIKK